jgi:glycosyltransferase involved in cell wall biosynthesis
MTRNCVLVLSTALSGGGAETVARLMVERLERSACVLFENDANISVPGTKIRVAMIESRGNFLVTLGVNVWRLFVIQWAKLKLRPVVTISHLEGPNIANVLTPFGGRKILFVHNQVNRSYQEDVGTNKIKLKLVRAMYHRADKVVGVSKEICEELVKSFNVDPDKVLFIQNPVSRSAIREGSNKTYGDFRDRFLEGDYLINVASLTAQKNQEFLLRVFQKLVRENERYSDLKLILLGDGDQRMALRGLCGKLELSVFDPNICSLNRDAQVCFLGFQSNPYPLIRRARLFVMTSLWEGLPIALLESMSLGVPGVLANCSEGIRSVWQVPENQQIQMRQRACHWTPYGALINGMDDANDTFYTWTTVISELLNDDLLHGNCSNASILRAENYDVSRVAKIWKQKLFLP